MKKTLYSLLFIFILSACGNTLKFPISNVAPAAEITVKKKMDKNNNVEIEVTANNLASSERLTPQRKTYVVWITTTDNGIKNIGQLVNENAGKATLTTITSFEPIEIFITGEDEGSVTYPTGTEISRTKF